MARLRITNWFVDEAASQLASMQTIDPALDFGGGLTLVAYSAAIEEARAKITSYNQQFSIAEEKRTLAKADDSKLKGYKTRFKSAVAARYGKDSEEYAKAGGTRTSERHKRKKSKPSSPNGESSED
jgi:hypothetical protein